MKAYFKKMTIKLLIVLVSLMGSYGSLGFTVKHSDTVDTIHTAKIEVFKSSDISKEIKKIIDSVEVEQQTEEAVQQVSAPVYSAPSVAGRCGRRPVYRQRGAQQLRCVPQEHRHHQEHVQPRQPSAD